MLIDEFILLQRVICQETVSSKKRALEILSHRFADNHPELDQFDIFDRLTERERLGSTGMGEGVAIPHCRLPSARQAMVAFMTLSAPVNFDARDHKPVDLLFALVVPEDCTDTHLKILALAAEMLSDKEFCKSARLATTPQALYAILNNWHPSTEKTRSV